MFFAKNYALPKLYITLKIWKKIKGSSFGKRHCMFHEMQNCQNRPRNHWHKQTTFVLYSISKHECLFLKNDMNRNFVGNLRFII